jgi:hypothetical protein
VGSAPGFWIGALMYGLLLTMILFPSWIVMRFEQQNHTGTHYGGIVVGFFLVNWKLVTIIGLGCVFQLLMRELGVVNQDSVTFEELVHSRLTELEEAVRKRSP